ncbi:hypothetical protein U1Q18_027164 [Sarracenia purpurea var. burkii]
MWRQRFPIRQENKVEKRMEVEEWVLTLAFPNGERLNRGMYSPGVYAFLPTEMVTNFPFIIQADFLLASSRETILLGNKWNQGILDCVPSAFISAFTSMVKNIEDAPVSSLPRFFEFLPINGSPYPELNAVRETIKAKLLDENIIPCESYTLQKFFHKPGAVGRLMPAFWNILNKARKEGVNLDNISSHGRYVLSFSFDRKEYDQILGFLGVKPVDEEWYAKCIRACNLILGVSEEVYLELLLFLAENWVSIFQKTNIKNIPLLKYVSLNVDVSLYSVNNVSQKNAGTVLVSHNRHHIPWLIDWNREFRCPATRFFVPKLTQEAIFQCSKRDTLLKWLSDELKVEAVDVNKYATLLINSLVSDRKLAVVYVHFLHHSLTKNFLSEQEVKRLCGSMPLVNNYGHVMTTREGVIVPAKGSNWVSLTGSNPWRESGFVELGEDYLSSGAFAGVYSQEKLLISFLKSYLSASDVPDISPPDVAIPALSTPLTKQNTFLLLDWIRNLRWKGVHMPRRFLTSIKEGSWMKISLSGSPVYSSPSQSFLPNSSWGILLQNESVLVDIPIIDKIFYGDKIDGYKEELRAIGVMFEYGEACQFIGKHFMSLAASSTLTRGNVISILKFIKFLKEKFLSAENFIHSISGKRWVITKNGCKSPVEAVLFDPEWRAASQISNIPFIDLDYYGEEILSFKPELETLRVIIGFRQSYQLVADHLKSPAHLTCLTAESGLFALECLHHLRSPDKLVRALKDTKFLKTNKGYMAPTESYLFNPEWGCLLKVFNCFPTVDQNFYGDEILLYKNELKQLGVVVEFDEATKAFARIFKQKAAESSIRKDNVLSILACCRRLKGTPFEFPNDLKTCVHEVKWLRTRLGDYRMPKQCILFGPDWESISPISLLPFIDDSDNYYGKEIYEYEKELKSIGVVISFRDGYRFVAAGIYLPPDPSTITPANVFSLLECVRNYLQQKDIESLPSSFLKKIDKEWLKTLGGYRTPDKCLLFNSYWNSFLQREDGPFIDEEFYGSKITSYSKELNELGVIVEVNNGCPLLVSHIGFHSNFDTIVRIYSYLREFKWEPENGYASKIWIPNGSDDGEWVTPGECVLRDKDGLFGTQLKVVSKHYDHKLLNFFSNAFKVKLHPSLDDYCKLWKAWECTRQQLSHDECCAFWQFVLKHWSSRTEKTLAEQLTKLPVISGSGEILLVERDDAFIADDLQLKELFNQSSSKPLFVWYPRPTLPSLPCFKLLEIYSKIGVRNISETVRKEEVSSIIMDGAGLNELNPREIFIGKGLLMLILGFLAGPSLQMEAEKRHETVRCLFNLTVLETPEPIMIHYSLSLSSGAIYTKLKSPAYITP